MCWNVWSILNEPKLTNFLQIIDDNDIGIACVCESWFDSEKGIFTKTIKKRGYKLHHAYREKRGGGSAIIYKKELAVKIGEASSTQYESFEYAYVTLTIQSKRRLLIANIYRNQEIAYTLFHDEFSAFMDKIMNRGDVLLIIGDFNVWMDVEGDMQREKLLTLMSGYGLSQMINEPTHRSGHTLDHMYINEHQVDFKHFTVNHTYGLSTDHYPLFIDIPFPKFSNTCQTVEFRKLKDVDITKFNFDLHEVCNDLSGELDFTTHITQFCRRAGNVVEDHAPLIARKPKTKDVAWVDQEYRRNRALRRKYERKWKKERTEESRMNYIEQKEICTELSQQKRKVYYSKMIESKGNCQKTLFKVANELLDKNDEKVLPAYTDSKKLANEFNTYYVEKVNKIRESIPKVDAESYYSRPFSGTERLCHFRPTTDAEVKKVIKESGIKTSVEDPIPAKLLQSSLDIVTPTFTALINKSLAEGSMEGVKSSVVDPLIKKAGLDADNKKNFRPVNNLVFFSKLIERIVLIRLEEHMSKNKLHENSQFAYKTHHNTEMMMLGLFEEALKGFDDNMATIVIFLDLSAAFDTIDIDKLLDILYSEIGIDGVALKWIRSFLSGRTQRVKIDNEYSESCEVPCGAPQGSVLGPRIFNINVRSQPQVFKYCMFNTSSFADDSNGRRTFALAFQFEVIKNDVVNCIDRIVTWSHAHFMKINPEKTELMLLYPSSLSREVIIKGVLLEDQCIRFSEKVKNVGVWIDCNLTLNKHVNSIISHSYKLLKDIGRVKKYISRSDLEKIVHAVISSRLDYCNSLLMNTSQINLQKYQKLQNAAARLILGRRRRDSATAALRELHWLNVEARITFKVILLVYKILHGLSTNTIDLQYKSFNGRSTDYLMLHTPNFKTKYGKRLFVFNGTRLWNALPAEMRMEEDVVSFKKRLKTLLFDNHHELKSKAFKYRT